LTTWLEAVSLPPNKQTPIFLFFPAKFLSPEGFIPIVDTLLGDPKLTWDLQLRDPHLIKQTTTYTLKTLFYKIYIKKKLSCVQIESLETRYCFGYPCMRILHKDKKKEER